MNTYEQQAREMAASLALEIHPSNRHYLNESEWETLRAKTAATILQKLNLASLLEDKARLDSLSERAANNLKPEDLK